MATEILMPQLKRDAQRGTVRKWRKKVGDQIREGEPLFSASVDKLAVEVNSAYSGTLLRILVAEGQSAACGQPVAILGAAGEELPDLFPEAEAAGAQTQDEAPVHVAVIGGGPGGYVAAIGAARRGARVTLIERDKLGGTCLNVGCIPTKTILYSAGLYARMRTAGDLGIQAEGLSVDWGVLQARKEHVSDRLREGVAALMAHHQVEVLTGEAGFTGPGALRVRRPDGAEETLTPDRVIIASGSAPVIPDIPGIQENSSCIDSTGALSLPEIPKSMAVIGGGVIGVELAWAYARLGTEVTVLEMLPKILPMMDGELTQLAQARMEACGVRFLLGCRVLAVEPGPAGARVRAVDKDGGPVSLEAEKVLVAVGRRPETAGLGLKAAGVETERGRILVDKKMQTSAPGVYAIGDCVGQVMLAHTASAMGETAAENATGGRAVYRGEVCPSCVYIDPELAGVGLSEEQATEAGVPYKVGRCPMAANGRALIEGDEGLVKVIAHKTSGKLLGVHILAPRATDLIAEAALAIRLGATARQLTETIHAHPTLAEAVREAALAADGNAIHTI
ncbi:MAG: dihydrolipoyl dehydrogenase [Clostridiales bacterium]|nr:dihydrolipoyl dehydrogenase [Clostridiales bacterium]